MSLILTGTSTGGTIASSTSGVAVQMQDSAANSNTCQAWVNFNGVTTVSIRASFNVSSVTRNGTGDYTVNFSNAFTDANYAFACTASRANISNQANVASPYTNAPTTTAFRFSTNSTALNDDSLWCSATFFR